MLGLGELLLMILGVNHRKSPAGYRYFYLIVVVLFACCAVGCSQSEGRLEVDVGKAPGAVSYQVDLFADQQGLPLLDAQMASSDGHTTFLKVETGKWSILIQALDGDQNTVAHCIAPIEIPSNTTIYFKAENYLPGLPGSGGSYSQGITLSRFGPGQVALLSTLYAAGSSGENQAVRTSIKVTSGSGTGPGGSAGDGLGNEEAAQRFLGQYDRYGGFGCATSLTSSSDSLSSLSVTPQALPGLMQAISYGDVEPGETANFFVTTTSKSVECMRLLDDSKTTHCLIFAEVKDGSPVLSEARALQIAQAFDSANPFLPSSNGIYADSRARLGQEWSTNPVGGRDGDVRVVFVFLSSSSIGGEGLFGFFWDGDEQAKSEVANSNEGEILYLNSERASADLYDILDTVAHEFSHLILWNHKVGRDGTFPAGTSRENVTLDEGLAVLNEELSGFSFQGSDGGNGFLLAAVEAVLEEGLNRPFFNFRQKLSDYGAGYLFWRYIYDRFGEEKLRDILTAPGTGRDNIAAVLGVPFAEVFAQFGQAVALNGADGLPQELAFSELDLDGTYQDRGGKSYSLQGLKNLRKAVMPGVLSDLIELEPWGMAFYWATDGDGSALALSIDALGSMVSGIFNLNSGEAVWSSGLR